MERRAAPAPSAANPQATGSTIANIAEGLIQRYFDSLNAADYEVTASLFAERGVLHPPFEEGVMGPEAIATYLQAEAKGMRLLPREGVAQPLDDGNTQVKVTGKVQTPLFGVNVSWIFLLSPEPAILSVQVRLLASPQELLKLRH